MNRGWMNVFRRWTTSSVFQDHWPALRGEFSEGFVHFCENELNLAVPTPGRRRGSGTGPRRRPRAETIDLPAPSGTP